MRSWRENQGGCLQSDRVLSFDKFGQSVGLRFSEESSQYRTGVGSLVTCLVYSFTLLFTIQNLVIWSEKTGTIFTSTMMKDDNEGTRSFTSEDGFKMAYALRYIGNDSNVGLKASEL